MIIKKIFVVLISIFFIASIYILEKNSPIIWDEADYINMGTYIYSHGAYGSWSDIRPIVAPLLFGLAWELDLNTIFYSRLIVVFFAIGVVYLVFIIGKKLLDDCAGLIASVLLSSSIIFIEFSTRSMTEIPAIFFALASIYLFIDNKRFLSGLLCGLAFLTRFPLFLVFISLLFISIYEYFKSRNLRNISNLSIGFGILFVTFMFFNYVEYGGFSNFILAQQLPAIDNPMTSWYEKSSLFYFENEVEQSYISIIAIVGIIYFTINRKIIKLNYLSILVSFLLLAVYFIKNVHNEFRYILNWLPFLSIIAGTFISTIIKLPRKKWYRRTTLIITIIFIVFIVQNSIVDFSNKSRNWQELPEEKLSETISSMSNSDIYDVYASTPMADVFIKNKVYTDFSLELIDIENFTSKSPNAFIIVNDCWQPWKNGTTVEKNIDHLSEKYRMISKIKYKDLDCNYFLYEKRTQ